MAGVTGLEPATSGVTGRRSNQLSYTPAAALRGGAYVARKPGGVKQTAGKSTALSRATPLLRSEVRARAVACSPPCRAVLAERRARVAQPMRRVQFCLLYAILRPRL